MPAQLQLDLGDDHREAEQDQDEGIQVQRKDDMRAEDPVRSGVDDRQQRHERHCHQDDESLGIEYRRLIEMWCEGGQRLVECRETVRHQCACQRAPVLIVEMRMEG